MPNDSSCNKELPMKGEKNDFEVEISTEGKEKSSATSVDLEKE
jgi:hypothetical protein